MRGMIAAALLAAMGAAGGARADETRVALNWKSVAPDGNEQSRQVASVPGAKLTFRRYGGAVGALADKHFTIEMGGIECATMASGNVLLRCGSGTAYYSLMQVGDGAVKLDWVTLDKAGK